MLIPPLPYPLVWEGVGVGGWGRVGEWRGEEDGKKRGRSEWGGVGGLKRGEGRWRGRGRGGKGNFSGNGIFIFVSEFVCLLFSLLSCPGVFLG